MGAGESSLGPTAGAIANAVANATGRRIRDLPFTSERVKLALGEDAIRGPLLAS
jgi:nicotinate dehydrogenase subunit B